MFKRCRDTGRGLITAARLSGLRGDEVERPKTINDGVSQRIRKMYFSPFKSSKLEEDTKRMEMIGPNLLLLLFFLLVLILLVLFLLLQLLLLLL